jgi:hypothetical protein
MRVNRHFIAAALAVVGVLPTVSGALAACTAFAKGDKWHFHGIEASPGGSGGSVIQCLMTFKLNGNFTAPCTVYQVGSSTPQSTTVGGKITLNTTKCDFTGTITITGDPTVAIKLGHINGNVGAGSAIQDTGANTQVIHFSIVQQ